MNKLLGNLNAIEKGEYNSTAKPESNEMKKILESFSNVSVQECGDMPMQQSMPQEQGNPVTMNVSLTASGKEHVDELMSLIKAAGLDNSAPVITKPEPDMEMPTDDQEMDMATMRQIMAAGEKDVEEEWVNSPDEEYKDDD